MRTCILILAGLFLGTGLSSQNLPGRSSLLTRQEALRLAELPLRCLQRPYPNKLSQTLADSSELLAPRQLHPAFYGCFDWHSSVHGHWMLIRLLKLFPDLPSAPEIKRKLLENLSRENIRAEVNYFRKPHEKSYERTYGWAWLLKLAEEIKTWDDPVARTLDTNLEPLTAQIVSLYMEFLPKLNYPVRVGEHPNTAFGLALARDFAVYAGVDTLKTLVDKCARGFYLQDADCPLSWEPGGTDFFSPCLEEADLMRRVLPSDEFRRWLQKFLPPLSSRSFNLRAGIVSDRNDGKLVHLDGLNFSRARCLYGIASVLPEYSHLKSIAYQHIMHSLPAISDGGYEGEHWLASFALLALISME